MKKEYIILIGFAACIIFALPILVIGVLFSNTSLMMVSAMMIIGILFGIAKVSDS